MKKLNLLIITAVFLMAASFSSADEAAMMEQAQAKTYEVDAAHSTLGFAVKHMVVGTTRGAFDTFNGQITLDPNNDQAFSANVTIDAASIDTKNESRDNHLKSADFFDVATHPQITFTNARLEKTEGGTAIVGDLTMKGVTKSVTIPVTIAGPVKGTSGADVIGIAGQIQINRQDFDIKWNKTLDSGGLVVDDVVNVIVEIEAKAG
ncbi:MAG TPA: YceI family protein [Candidatus Omnitrophota bacterium]|nr:YceI family protein [Candidatus Omnitrophota bacterium]